MRRGKFSDAAQLIRDIERIAGADVAEAFLRSAGGRAIYVPKLKCRNWETVLTRALGGLDKARPIIEQIISLGYGGLNFEIPRFHTSAQHERMLLVQEAIIAGSESTGDIATRLKLTSRCIARHRARLRKAGLLPPARSTRVFGPGQAIRQIIERDLATIPAPDQVCIEDIARRNRVAPRTVRAIQLRLRTKVGRGNSSVAAQLVRDIERVAGADVAEAFLRSAGGRSIYVPTLKCRNWETVLTRALGGLDKARPIIEQIISLGYGGLRFEIPRFHTSAQHERMLLVQEAIIAGLESGDEIAARLKLTSRCIANHRACLRKAGLLPPARSTRVFGPGQATRQIIERDLATIPAPDQVCIEDIARRNRVAPATVRAIHRQLQASRTESPPLTEAPDGEP